MITQQKEYSAIFDKEIRKYDSPLAKIPPLKVNTVTISLIINLVKSLILISRQISSKFSWMSTISRKITFLAAEIVGLVRVFLADLLHSRHFSQLPCEGKPELAWLRYLLSHLNLDEQLSWREIQIDQSELSRQAMKLKKTNTSCCGSGGMWRLRLLLKNLPIVKEKLPDKIDFPRGFEVEQSI